MSEDILYTYHYYAMSVGVGKKTTHIEGLITSTAMVVSKKSYALFRECIANEQSLSVDSLTIKSLSLLHIRELI